MLCWIANAAAGVSRSNQAPHPTGSTDVVASRYGTTISRAAAATGGHGAAQQGPRPYARTPANDSSSAVPTITPQPGQPRHRQDEATARPRADPPRPARSPRPRPARPRTSPPPITAAFAAAAPGPGAAWRPASCGSGRAGTRPCRTEHRHHDQRQQPGEHRRSGCAPRRPARRRRPGAMSPLPVTVSTPPGSSSRPAGGSAPSRSGSRRGPRRRAVQPAGRATWSKPAVAWATGPGRCPPCDAGSTVMSLGEATNRPISHGGGQRRGGADRGPGGAVGGLVRR